MKKIFLYLFISLLFNNTAFSEKINLVCQDTKKKWLPYVFIFDMKNNHVQRCVTCEWETFYKSERMILWSSLTWSSSENWRMVQLNDISRVEGIYFRTRIYIDKKTYDRIANLNYEIIMDKDENDFNEKLRKIYFLDASEARKNKIKEEVVDIFDCKRKEKVL